MPTVMTLLRENNCFPSLSQTDTPTDIDIDTIIDSLANKDVISSTTSPHASSSIVDTSTYLHLYLFSCYDQCKSLLLRYCYLITLLLCSIIVFIYFSFYLSTSTTTTTTTTKVNTILILYHFF